MHSLFLKAVYEAKTLHLTVTLPSKQATQLVDNDSSHLIFLSLFFSIVFSIPFIYSHKPFQWGLPGVVNYCFVLTCLLIVFIFFFWRGEGTIKFKWTLQLLCLVSIFSDDIAVRHFVAWSAPVSLHFFFFFFLYTWNLGSFITFIPFNRTLVTQPISMVMWKKPHELQNQVICATTGQWKLLITLCTVLLTSRWPPALVSSFAFDTLLVLQFASHQ